MTAWDYDEEVNAACIHIIPRDAIPQGHVKTIDLEGIHVLIDVDTEGNVLTIELLGHATILKGLGRYLQQEANNGNDDHGQ